MPMHFAPGAGSWPAGVSGQYLPLPYMPVSCGGKLGLFGEQLGFFGGGGCGDLQQHDLAAEGGRQLQMVEAVALRGQRERVRREHFIHPRGSGLGVVGDVGLRGPLGVGCIGIHFEQLGVGAIDEGLRLGDGGRGLRGRLLGMHCAGNCAGEEGKGETDCGLNAHGGSINPRAKPVLTVRHSPAFVAHIEQRHDRLRNLRRRQFVNCCELTW